MNSRFSRMTLLSVQHLAQRPILKTSVVFFTLLLSAASLPAQTRRNYTVDLENRNPAVGVLVVTEPDPAGLPLRIRGFCSGALIGDRVFLVAGHCTGPGVPEVPPFIKLYVTFSPIARDQSSWIPVKSLAVHPTMPPCPLPVGCDPTFTSAFQAGDPAVADLGLVFLSRSAAGIKPAPLAAPGSLEEPQSRFIPSTTIG